MINPVFLKTVDNEPFLQIEEHPMDIQVAVLAGKKTLQVSRHRFSQNSDGADDTAINFVNISGDDFLSFPAGQEGNYIFHEAMFVEGSLDIAEYTPHQIEICVVRQGEEGRLPFVFGSKEGLIHRE
jgi:hypothetical protein